MVSRGFHRQLVGGCAAFTNHHRTALFRTDVEPSLRVLRLGGVATRRLRQFFEELSRGQGGGTSLVHAARVGTAVTETHRAASSRSAPSEQIADYRIYCGVVG